MTAAKRRPGSPPDSGAGHAARRWQAPGGIFLSPGVAPRDQRPRGNCRCKLLTGPSFPPHDNPARQRPVRCDITERMTTFSLVIYVTADYPLTKELPAMILRVRARFRPSFDRSRNPILSADNIFPEAAYIHYSPPDNITPAE
ncbi:hypothetical protein CO2235_MP80089 [Cupriavidus oxalaticus]|uniref:Uncharacterized protein n=1 Tax=Cupriavidus oxalaticus TaxID=96344 RepID=A0A375GLR9_9BURK|nr:hypothetical protein CO2235_MP80089 [Cupriavidus oxalaticus]